jgi:hypothetical protein
MARRKQITLSLPPDLIEQIDADRQRDIWPDDFARQRWIEVACREALALFAPPMEFDDEEFPYDPSPQSAGRPAGESSDGRNGGRDPDRAGTSPEAAGKTNSTESGGRLHGVSPPLDGPVSQGETPKSASSPTPSEDVPNREIWVHQRAAELGLFMPQGAAAEQAASEYDEQFGETTF